MLLTFPHSPPAVPHMARQWYLVIAAWGRGGNGLTKPRREVFERLCRLLLGVSPPPLPEEPRFCTRQVPLFTTAATAHVLILIATVARPSDKPARHSPSTRRTRAAKPIASKRREAGICLRSCPTPRFQCVSCPISGAYST